MRSFGLLSYKNLQIGLPPATAQRWVRILSYDCTMRIAESLIAELEREAKSTVRMLERIPKDRLEWQPHEKSMSIGQLAWHVATLPRMGVLGLKEKKRETGQ